MRITRVRIDSFGGLKDREYELGPGLNVFYGPNESGKTTVMEFIRTVLVPTTKRMLYPERSKKDSGFLTFDEASVQGRVDLDRKQLTKAVPDYISSMDPALYRSIFALDLEGLNDMGSVSDDEIRSRFLTVPGGDRIPELMDDLDADMNDLVGKVASSKSQINRNRSELDQL